MQTTSKSAKTTFIVLGVLMLLIGAAAAWLLMDGMGEDAPAQDPSELPYFDAYTGTEEEQVLYFNALTDSFAAPALGDSHNIHFVLDASSDGTFVYLVCLSDEQFASYRTIYEETFSDSAYFADYGYVTGYPMEISPDLQSYAIEYFNDYFLGTDLLTEDNFSEYVGNYYLDATYRPESAAGGMNLLAAGIAALAFLALAVYFFFKAFSKPKAPPVSASPDGTATAPEGPSGQPESSGQPVQPGVAVQQETAVSGEVSAPAVSRGLGLLGAVLGALVGCIAWVLLMRAGYIAGIAGFLIIFLAMQGHKLLGGGLDRSGVVLSVLVSLVMLALANAVGYAWMISDAVNDLNPGRSSVAYILQNFGDMMDLLELWPDFIGDLAIGVVLTVVVAFSSVASAFRAAKKPKEEPRGPEL